MIGRNQIRYIKSGTVPRTGTPLEGERSICIGEGGGGGAIVSAGHGGQLPVGSRFRGITCPHDYPGSRLRGGGVGRGARSRENDEGERGRLPDVVRVYDKLMVFRGGQPSSSTFGGRSHAKIQIVRPTVPLIIYGPSSLSSPSLLPVREYRNCPEPGGEANTFLIERIHES